jgi:23S rRNA pseudouridine1911/1915/1917 synthase
MERLETTVERAADRLRLDRFLTDLRPGISRSEIQRQIGEGRVTISGEPARRPARRVRVGDRIVWEIPDAVGLSPAAIPLSVLFEDDALVAVDKPIGLVVHPGAGTAETTLVEGLLLTRALPESDDPSRPGIVHRLDKGTSGVIVVAKSAQALASLQDQFARRTVSKTYLAVVAGVLEEDEGIIDAPVGRDPARPSRMAIVPTGRPARTEFHVLDRRGGRTLLQAHPHTGRTHQIRTHFQYIKHPVVGDDTYGGPPAERMLLHAWRLTLRHPSTGQELRLEAPVPPAFPDFPYDSLPWRRRDEDT